MTTSAVRDEQARANHAWLAEAWERGIPFPGDPDTCGFGDLADFVRADQILAEHPDREEKEGVGFSGHYRIYRMPGNLGFHLALVRTDGTLGRLRVSRPWASVGPRQRLMRVLREEVRPQGHRERMDRLEAGVTTCEECGAELDDTAQMDHFPVPFVQLADAWLATQDEIPLVRRELTAEAARTTDRISEMRHPWQRRSWQAFHWAHARLRLTCASCNTAAGDHGTAAARERSR